MSGERREDGPRTDAGKRLDTAWPVNMDRLDWREAIVAVEDEALVLRQEAARDALALIHAAQLAGVHLPPTEARRLAAQLAATPERREDGWDELRREIEAREALREPIIRAVAALDGYENPNTAPGDWWDRRTAPVLAAVLAIIDRLTAATPPPEPDILPRSDTQPPSKGA